MHILDVSNFKFRKVFHQFPAVVKGDLLKFICLIWRGTAVPGGVQKMCGYGTSGHGLEDIVVLGWQLDLMIIRGLFQLLRFYDIFKSYLLGSRSLLNTGIWRGCGNVPPSSPSLKLVGSRFRMGRSATLDSYVVSPWEVPDPWDECRLWVILVTILEENI